MIELFDPLTIFNTAELFRWFTEHADYWFVFLFMVIESSFIPFPSEVVVPPAAYLAVTKGDMNIYIVIILATAGALVGALINYYLSMWIGRPVVYAFADTRIGHMLLIDRTKVDKAERYFDKHGAVSTLIGRLIPAVRQLISIPAGLSRMNIWKFMLYTSLGALIWNSILGGLGYWLGRTVPFDDLFNKVEQYNSYLSYAGIALLLVCAVYITYKALRPSKK